MSPGDLTGSHTVLRSLFYSRLNCSSTRIYYFIRITRAFTVNFYFDMIKSSFIIVTASSAYFPSTALTLTIIHLHQAFFSLL